VNKSGAVAKARTAWRANMEVLISSSAVLCIALKNSRAGRNRGVAIRTNSEIAEPRSSNSSPEAKRWLPELKL
jgi:hypothetical protein